MQGVEKRWRDHEYEIASAPPDTTRKLHKRAQEVGFEKFSKVKLMGNLTMEEANMTEQYLIAKYDTYHHGLNSTPGGDTWGYGPQHSEACKAAWVRDPQRRIKQLIRLIGKTWSWAPEKRANVSGENHWCFGKLGPEHPAFGKTWTLTLEQRANRSGENSYLFGKTGTGHPAFGKKKTQEQIAKSSGQNHGMFGKPGAMLGKTGALCHNSKPVCVFGKVYPAAIIASDELRKNHAPNRQDNFIKEWMRTKKHQPYTFYVMNDFYVHALLFDIENITRIFYDQWLVM